MLKWRKAKTVQQTTPKPVEKKEWPDYSTYEEYQRLTSRGKSLSQSDIPLEGTLSLAADVVALWNVVGHMAEKIERLEDASDREASNTSRTP